MSIEEDVEVRSFEVARDFEGMIDYFLGGDDAFLEGMGVDLSKLPTREAWLADVLLDHERPDAQKERAYVAWLHCGEVVGHSSISQLVHGETGNCHLHLWRADLRGQGFGPAFLKRSVDLYFERLGLKSVASEPYAENPVPNHVLPKLGFRLVKRFRTTPGGMCFEQDVKRWEVQRDEWFTRHPKMT